MGGSCWPSLGLSSVSIQASGSWGPGRGPILQGEGLDCRAKPVLLLTQPSLSGNVLLLTACSPRLGFQPLSVLVRR